MTHRELMLSRSGPRARHAFLALPEELQDRIIEGLDAGELTFAAAAAAIRAEGHRLSHEAVSDYYRAVRRERRLFGLRDNLGQLLRFAEGDPDAGRRALLNLTLVSALQGLADGEIGIKDIDLARLLAASGNGSRSADAPAAVEETAAKPGGLSEATAEEIRRRILTG